jgi:membrane dipeptidase
MSGFSRMTRRNFVVKSAGAALAAPMIGRGAYAFAAAPDRVYSRRAVDLVAASLVIDMLAPLKIDISDSYYTREMPAGDKDEFRGCGITGFHNAWGIGGPDAYQDVLANFAGWQGFAARNADIFSAAGKVGDLDAAKADGKCCVIMGIQNSEHFRSVEDVAFFHGLGQRVSQLTYNAQNLLGSGSTERVDGGVTDFGAAIIAEMEKTGMLVDTSHCGDRTTLDAIDIASGPIAITHSNCRALVDHPRVKTDEAIRALAAKGGVMGISGVSMFIKDRDPTTIGDLVDHIDHVRDLVGIDHVGIGSDADLNGYDDMPPDQYAALKASYKGSYAFRDKIDVAGFDHPKKIFDLTEELIRRNYTDEHIALVLGGNFRRLLATVWR